MVTKVLEKINDSYNKVFDNDGLNKENDHEKSADSKRTHLSWFTSNKTM